MNTAMKVAVTLPQATQLVPFSEDYLRRAVHRTAGNTLPARFAGRKYIVLVADLEAWMRKEGDPA